MGTPQIDSESWQAARLIPTVGIRGQEEQEKRATSSLLAVMHAAPEFAHALLGPLGAPKARPKTFTEVRFRDAEGRACIPDGAIVATRGNRSWSCLVEVKTGAAELDADQVRRYLDLARGHGFDGVLSISNAITASHDDSPIAIDRRKLRRVCLWHLSWSRVLTEAIVQHRFRGVSDPDQAWILGELVAYLDAEASGASGFDDMGREWVQVRDSARAGTLRFGAEVRAVAARWDQFVEYLALSLSRELGTEVSVVRPRRQAPGQQLETLARELAESGRLSGGLRVPHAVAPIFVTADLGRRQVETSVTIDAPSEGRATSRVNWLLRQLRDAGGELRVESRFEASREVVVGSLAEAREAPNRLLSDSDPRRAPRSFTLALTRSMGLKRGKARGSFVGETRQQTFDFYREIVQSLKRWQPRAPRLREEAAAGDEPPRPEDLPAAPGAAAVPQP
jgi:hypothetical protein